MKRNTLTILFYACLFSIVTATASQARDVTLKWDPSTDPSVTGYKIYYDADSASPPFSGIGASQGASPYNTGKITTATLNNLDPGKTYYFAVTAYNAAGTQSSYSNIVNVAEATPPTVSIPAPATNTTISGTVSVTASATDNVGVTKVEFYLNGVLKITDTSTPYLYSLSTAALTSGTYTLMAKAYDAAGNIGQSSTVSVTVINDTTAPAVSLTSPVNNATVSGTTTLTASASDNVGVSKVEFYRSGTLIYATNVAPFSYGWNTATVANGSYTMTAKAYDNTGNIAQSANVLVNVNNTVADTTPPTVSTFSMPTTSTTLKVPITSFIGSDNVGVTAYCITSTNSTANCDWLVSPNTSFTFGSTGTKTAYGWVRDAAGKVSVSKSATVNIGLSDTTAPTVSVTAPVNNATVSGTVSVTSSASDNVGVSKVEFYVNGVLQATDSASPYSFSWNAAALTAGSYVLMTKAYDTAGNIGQSAGVTVAVKNTITAVFGNATGANYSNTIEDTFLNLNTDINATSKVLNAYTWPAAKPANAIIMKWNVSAIPANAQIVSATLSLYLTASGGDVQYEMPVSKIINKTPVITTSTGKTYDGTNAWTASSVPYGGIPLAQSDISTAAAAPLVDKTTGYKNWDVTSIIKDWMATPANNRGLLLNSSSKATADSSRVFASSEAVEATQRPKLVVTYVLQ